MKNNGLCSRSPLFFSPLMCILKISFFTMQKKQRQQQQQKKLAPAMKASFETTE